MDAVKKGEVVPVQTLLGRWIGLAFFVVAGTAVFLLMANDTQIPHGPLIGLGALTIGVIGLFWSLGLFCDFPAASIAPWEGLRAREGEAVWRAPPLAIAVSLLVLV